MAMRVIIKNQPRGNKAKPAVLPKLFWKLRASKFFIREILHNRRLFARPWRWRTISPCHGELVSAARRHPGRAVGVPGRPASTGAWWNFFLLEEAKRATVNPILDLICRIHFKNPLRGWKF